MGKLLLRLFLPLPLILTVAVTEAKAQPGGIGIGIGIGTGFPGFGPGYGYGGYGGYGYGPYWGPGFGRFGYPGWYPGVFPGQMYGNYSNGLSMYGPPVPTYKPIPGMFGGGDSRFFPPPPAYRPWGYNFAYLPISKPVPVMSPVPFAGPAPLPPAIGEAEVIPSALTVLTDTAPLEMEIYVPKDDAQVFIDGQETTSAGSVRMFKSPPLGATDSHTYEVKAVWMTTEGKVSHTKKVTVRTGERVRVAFRE
ncbi:TIGR03000 domain-containing protein [Zavarzinella formosa]|uniref:TIGR03000 domain-containing protein n=1 Tax=Zavarzinella formosa TaxID=360055 RepID=UPI0002F9E70A|nr:TIGR03000 domain-containing protein [Zavarzinella formosa]